MPSFMKYITDTFRCANYFRSEKLSQIDLNVNQYPYILNICNNPGILQDQLGKLIYVHKSNVARQLKLLEEKGFITKKCDEKDKRNLLVYPTQKALDAYPLIKKINNEWVDLVLNGISEKEQEEILKYCLIISENAKKVVSDLKRGEVNEDNI